MVIGSAVRATWRALALAGAVGLWGCSWQAPATPPRVADRDAPEIASPARVNGASSTPIAASHSGALRRAVASAHPLASEAGLNMLRQGGSAVDAAVAVQAVLGLVEPQSSGLGGGAFLVLADHGGLVAWDGRETAPASADERLFLDAEGRTLAFALAMASGRSVGVPGVLRMLEAAHRAHGRLPWAQLFQPAIDLAEHGFVVSPRLAAQLADDAWLRADTAARALFYPGGQPLQAGDTLRNPEYAWVLREVAQHGADALYSGPVATAIVRAVRQHPVRPGGLTLADLGAYQPIRRTALCMPWRQWRLCGMPPPSSGMLALGQILALLDAVPAKAQAATPGERWHRYIEASRLAFADRDQYVADPAFTPAPGGDWASLWSPAYLARRASLIGERAMQAAPPGEPGPVARVAPDSSLEVPATSHVSIVDGQGQVLAMTTTIEAQFGSRIMVNTGEGRAGGFLLNNELTDFSFVAREGGLPVANRVAGGKRPRSSMAPTLVLDRQTGEPVATLGAPGGAAIIHYVAKTLLGALDEGLSLQAAIDRPNIGPLSGRAGTPVLVERGAWPADTLKALAERGHRVEERDLPSGVQGLLRRDTRPDSWEGGADRRREGLVLGDR